MKGTKLWQEAGSPLIRGRSRTEKPFWQPWIAAWGIALVASIWVTYLFVPLSWASLADYGVALAGSAAGSAFGVWLARRLGSRPAWLAGAAIGAGIAIVGVYIALNVYPVPTAL